MRFESWIRRAVLFCGLPCAVACSSPIDDANVILADVGLRSAQAIAYMQDHSEAADRLCGPASSTTLECRRTAFGILSACALGPEMPWQLSDLVFSAPPAKTWTFTPDSCEVVQSSDPELIGTDCAGTETIQANGDGSATQRNEGALSSGEGAAESFLFQIDERGQEGYLFVQENHATGQGCEQDAINVIVLDPPGTADAKGTNLRPYCVFTYIKDSTCGSVGLWKASGGLTEFW